jgi:hypothetical protein
MLLSFLNEVFILPAIPGCDAWHDKTGTIGHLLRRKCTPQTPPLAIGLNLMRIGRWRGLDGRGMVAQRTELRISPPDCVGAMSALNLEAVVDGRMRRSAADAAPPMDPTTSTPGAITYCCCFLVTVLLVGC